MRRALSIPPAGPLLVLVLCIAACDGSGRACEQARGHLERGELERAEACLVEARGAEAESLRASIDQRRANRAGIQARITELRTQLDVSSAGALDTELAQLLEFEHDAIARRTLEQARIEFAELFAARDRRGLGLTVLGSGGSQQAGAVGLGERQRVLGALRQDAGLALEERAWSRAARLLDKLARFRELDAAELAALREELLAGAAEEADQLLSQAAELESGGDPRAALVFLERQRARFPATSEFGFFYQPLTELAARVSSAPSAAEGADSGQVPGAELSPPERARLVRSYLDLDHEARSTAWPSLLALRDQSVPGEVLAAVVEQASAVLLQDSLLEDFARLADLRATLDIQRAEALALILDEETYFYPHDPPAPPHTRTEYVRAQRLVHERVELLRAVWDEDLEVELSPAVRAASADLRWALEQPLRSAAEGALPNALPAHMLALPADLGQVSVREFAWTPAEARALDLGRRVRELNTRAIEEARGGLPGLGLAGIPDADERELMRLCNDYRAMFGRPVLAWDARLQAASQGHSEYMRERAILTHTEEDPARRQVVDRARLVGYAAVTGENCAHHRLGPQAVFTLWVHSSGHHRNLLHEAYREVGTACAQDWWTQVLGYGTEYREALKR